MNSVNVIGLASALPLIAMLALLLGGGAVVEALGPWLLIAPVVGVAATFAALFLVYKNRPLGWSGLGWIAAFVVAWFLVLPVFWYLKLYRPGANAT